MLAGKGERDELDVEVGMDCLINDGLESDGIEGCNNNGDGYAPKGEEFSHVGERNEMALGHERNQKEVRMLYVGGHGRKSSLSCVWWWICFSN